MRASLKKTVYGIDAGGTMLARILRKAMRIVSFPMRYAIQHEPIPASQDIGKVLQERATAAAADYVERHMQDIDSVSSKFDLLTMAIAKAELGGGKLICEFGVYSGETANHIAALTGQTVYGFDSFDGLPERWRDGFRQGFFKVAALPKVRPNVVLIKGWFDRSLPEFLKDHSETVGFLHVDCDLYSSTKTIFELMAPQIHPGCVIVFDEYFNYPGWEEGEYKAFREFLEQTGLAYDYIGYNRLHEQVAVKIKAGTG